MVEFSIVQSRRRVDWQVVLERPADIVKPNTRVRDCWCVVGSSGFDDEDLRAGRGQFRGKNRTGGPCSHHDEVISPFFIRLVDQVELPGFSWLSHPLHKYSGEVLAVPIENNQQQDCYHRRRCCSARIQEHVITNDVHDYRSKQHQCERYESVHEQ